MASRLRIFAGPNGSGKSTLYESLVGKKYFRPKNYINPDLIDEKLPEGLSLGEFSLAGCESSFMDLIKNTTYDIDVSKVLLKNDRVYLAQSINNNLTYYPAAISDAIRELLLEKCFSLSFESVFSHNSKLELMKLAKEKGYKVYFYFISTDSPDINVRRVEIRNSMGGHNVPEEKTRSRYPRCLDNLYDAILLSDKAYVFDNSDEKGFVLIAEKKDDKIVIKQDCYPEWFDKYFVNKYKEEGI